MLTQQCNFNNFSNQKVRPKNEPKCQIKKIKATKLETTQAEDANKMILFVHTASDKS
jgi:hypothetical protein